LVNEVYLRLVDANSVNCPNIDLLWSVRHLLSQVLKAQGKFAEAVEMSKEAQKSVEPANGVVSIRVRQTVAAWDYVFAVAHWEGSTKEQRKTALRGNSTKRWRVWIPVTGPWLGRYWKRRRVGPKSRK